MEDIRLAIGLIAFLSVGIFLLSVRLLNDRPKWVIDATAVGVLVVIGLYVRFVWGQLWIVQWIPLPSVIVLANWFPLFLAVLAATVWTRLPEKFWYRRLFSQMLIMSGAVYSVMYFIPIEPPECGVEWSAGGVTDEWPVCRQTTKTTCSAAAAATILNTIGIHTSEQEMARLSLTRSGTTWLGLYHGLSLKLQGSGHRVEFFEGSTRDLPELSRDSPMILCCRLTTAAAESAPQYVDDGGWIPGVAHSVVYFSGQPGRHHIGDPSRGHEDWSDQDMDTVWTGEGLRLVRVAPAPNTVASAQSHSDETRQ